MSDAENLTRYRKVFRDIVKGYSKNDSEFGLLYIKHLTTHDQVDLEEIEERFYKKAKEKGLCTEEERLASLYKEDSWTKEDESFIHSQRSYIENLEKSKSQLILKSQIDNQQKLIEAEFQKLNKSLNIKNELIGSTFENYSQKRINDYYISKSFFKDEFFKEPLYSEKEYDELSYTDISKLILIHNQQFNLFSEENIQKLILEEFYFPYMPFCEDSVQFFGLAVCKLTHNQLKLLLFTRIFKNIFDNNDNIPEKIRKDPQALLDYASSSKKGKDLIEQDSEKGGASTIVGATKEDYEYMGVDTTKGKSLDQAAKSKGGSLNMQDLMNLAGE